MSHDRFHDSAGVPWEGREFSQNQWSNDDGSCPPDLAAVLATGKELGAVFEALRGQRLLIPLLAQLGESEVGPNGLQVDKSAELSIVAVATPNGGSAIPAFSSVAEMQKWRPDARPVPVGIEKLALAAVAEGHNQVILDPASHAIGLRRPMLAALAQGVPWRSPEGNPEVRELVEFAARGLDPIQGFSLVAADPDGTLVQPELLVMLKLKPGLGAQDLAALLEEFTSRLQTERYLQLVDSMGLKLVS